jgi:lipopolysaccharide/colanic/teichoic acid biosynthesis glycosyltransferase
LKRAADLFLAATGLLMLSPLLAVAAALVKLGSRGPVFFGHAREGRRGREFKCWKFRTMVADADQRQRALYKQSQVDGPQFKIKDDPRVTRVGRILRGTNIDELPQLWNVLIGEMSLVGPRPSPFRENQICVPWRRARLSVRPGITGLWQVCRDEDRDKGDFHEWIFYDVTYVRHFSFWLDIKILVATVLTMGGRRSVALGRLLPQLGREVVGVGSGAAKAG